MENVQNLPEIYKIMISEPMNKLCLDCKKPYPIYASVNNGVFLCETCAQLHKMHLNYKISSIRGLDDEWDEYLLMYTSRGGNTRFMIELNKYEIDLSEPLVKYNVQGMENYRFKVKSIFIQLRSEILADEPPEPLSREQGGLPSKDLDFNPYPEFENYQLMKETQQNNTVQKKGFFDSVRMYLDKVGEKVKTISHNLHEKVKKYEIGEKLKHTGEKAFYVMKQAGKYVIMKSEPVVETIKETTKGGYEKIKEKTINLVSNIKDKITGEKIDDQKKDNGEIPTSDYYELKKNQTIDNFIYSKEEEQKVDKEEIHEADICDINDINALARGNSFTLLKESNNNKEQNNGILSLANLPTFQDIQEKKEQICIL